MAEQFGADAQRKTEKTFAQIDAEMKARGFSFAGIDNLTEIRFIDGIFRAVPTRTKEEIIAKHKAEFEKQGVKVDVELIDDDSATQKQQLVFVFVKK